MNEEDCRKVFGLLSEYLDRELPAESCAELERHIAHCPPCVQFVDSLRKSIQICRNYESPGQTPPLSPEAKLALKAAYEKMIAARQPASRKSDPSH